MAKDDFTEISSPCICGKGKIIVTQTMPDHPWVRAGQISYEASLACSDCSQTYVVRHDYHHLPSLVRREDVTKQSAAAALRKAAEDDVISSPQAQRLIPRIISAVNSQPSMAARHRVLQHFRLSYESLGTYRKRPYDGERAVKNISGARLAAIGSKEDMSGDDVRYFIDAANEITRLEEQERALAVRPVKTSAQWMRL